MRLPAVRDEPKLAPAEVLLDAVGCAPPLWGRVAEGLKLCRPDRGQYFIRNLPSDVCAHWYTPCHLWQVSTSHSKSRHSRVITYRPRRGRSSVWRCSDRRSQGGGGGVSIGVLGC